MNSACQKEDTKTVVVALYAAVVHLKTNVLYSFVSGIQQGLFTCLP